MVTASPLADGSNAAAAKSMDQFSFVSSSTSSKKPSLSKPRLAKVRRNAASNRKPSPGFQEPASDSSSSAYFNPFRSGMVAPEPRVSERSGGANFDAGSFVFGGGGRSVKSPPVVSVDGSGLDADAGVFVFGSGVYKLEDENSNVDSIGNRNLSGSSSSFGSDEGKQGENAFVGSGSLLGLNRGSTGFVFGSGTGKIADLGQNSLSGLSEESHFKLANETGKLNLNSSSNEARFENASEKPGVGSFSFGGMGSGIAGGFAFGSGVKKDVGGGLYAGLPEDMRKMNLSNEDVIANKVVEEENESLNVGRNTAKGSTESESVGCGPGAVSSNEGFEEDKKMGRESKVDLRNGFVFGNSGNVSTSFGSEFMTNEGTKSNMCSIPSCPAPSFQSFGSTFTFTGKPGGSETPQMEFKTPKQEPARLTKESLFTGTNQNISFSVKKCDAKSTRTKKKKGLSRQSASVHQVFPKQFVNVENETNENPEVGSDGAYSPMDYSPYREDSVANHCSREPSVASVDSILFGSNDANDDGKRNSSADSVYADEQISEFEKDSDVSKYENVGLDSNVRVAPMEPETGFFSSNPERQVTEGGGGFTFSSSLEDLGESKFTFSTSMFNQSKVSASQHSYRRRSRSKSAQNSSVSTPNARVPLTSPLPDLIPQMSTSGLLDLLRQKSTSSIPQSADESKTGESRESRVTKEPTGSTTANISAQEACEKWRYRGNQAYADGNLSKAEDYYSRGINSVSLKDIPGSCIQPLTLCYSNRAATRMSLGRMREALSDCKMAVSIDPEFLKARVRVGNCHLALGEIGEALEQFKECLLSDKDVRTNKKYLNEASDGLQKAQQVADLTGQAAELLLKRTSDGASKALSEICKALLISPYSENLLEMKAEALIMMRNYDEVIKLCEQTLDLAEQNSILNEDSQFRTEYMKVSAAKLWRWHLISKSYFCLGKLEDALELIQKTEEVKVAVDKISYKNQSVESSTSFAITIRKLLSLKSAGNEAFQAGKHLEAVECYSAALSCNAESRPFTAICFCNRAAAYQALGQMTDAIADCSLAVALDPSYLKAISRRATLHEMIRDYGQASNDLNRLVSLLEKQMEVNRPGAVGRSANTASDLNKARLRLAKVEEEARKGVSLNMYMILGVEPSSSAADVKKAYRKAALRHHPDKAGQFLVKNDNVDDGLWKEVAAEVHTDADRLFKMIGEAYTILSDPTKRQQYDDEEEMRTVPRKDNYGSTTPKTSSYTYSSYYEKNVNRPQWQAHGSSYQRW